MNMLLIGGLFFFHGNIENMSEIAVGGHINTLPDVDNKTDTYKTK